MDARDGKGRWTRDPDVAKRDAQAAEMRAAGHTYPQIADTLGFADKSHARKAVEKVLKETVQEPADAVRKIELERLDTLWRAAMGVLERDHLTVSHGKIIRRQVRVDLADDGTETPVYEDVLDDGPLLNAVDRLLRIQERRARLLGLDSPSRVSVDAEHLGSEIGALINALATGEASGADDDDTA